MEKANDSKILRVNGAIATDNSITLITKVNGMQRELKKIMVLLLMKIARQKLKIMMT